MRIVGIDPGAVSAAWGLLTTSASKLRPSTVCCGDIPVVNKMVDASGLRGLLVELSPDLVVIEEVGAMPKQGVASTFRFGFGCGVIRGVVQALELPIVLVTPAKWKREMHLDSDGEKSRALAIRMFPAAAPLLQRVKDHGRAEALLLAAFQANRLTAPAEV